MANHNSKPLKIGLVLQGGGALGSYHIGAYQAMAEAGQHPDWIAGISIGAINAAVIAGNPPDARVDRLTGLWETISWPDLMQPVAVPELPVMNLLASGLWTSLAGQPSFFTPRLVSPWLTNGATPDVLSYYDTTPLRATLPRFVDFDLINQGNVRLSLGATNVATGNLEFFDSHRIKIGPEHVMASGSLPPGFPATEVNGQFYWDGGCVSNTPLEALLLDRDHPRMVVFMIDLWGAAGDLPRTMLDVMWRAKQIQYASRTSDQLKSVEARVNLEHQRTVETGEATIAATYLAGLRLEIVHIIYHPGPHQIPNSDAEFSRASIAERREAGYRDMRQALLDAPWDRAPPPPGVACRLHRISRAVQGSAPHGTAPNGSAPNGSAPNGSAQAAD